MRRRGVPLFYIYTIVLALCVIIGIYADNGMDIYVSNCSAELAAVCIVFMMPKILQMITGWKFLSFLCMLAALMMLLAGFVGVLVANDIGSVAGVSVIFVMILSLITVIFEIRELSR